MRLSIFDFDGTLFASPERPPWWPFQGFWGRPESLNPPYVPERPGNDWWAPKVVAAARQAISDTETYTALLTGRQPKLGPRIKQLLHGEGLRFDEYHFSNGDNTLPFKLGVIENLVLKVQPEWVDVWEDRGEHIGSFESTLRQLGVDFKVHKVSLDTHEFENALPLKVASRC